MHGTAMQPILEMRGITKTFPGVNALENVNLTVMPAEIHGVVHILTTDLTRTRQCLNGAGFREVQ